MEYRNMFEYENLGMFVNDSSKYYPFNITNEKDVFIEDFWVVISNLIEEINNDNMSKIRFVWIDAGSYCQTEIFLKQILLKKHGSYPVLYLHWIDFINSKKSVLAQLFQEQIDGKYFLNDQNTIKICVIDHAEKIEKREQYLELCRRLYKDRCIFIFVSKKDIPVLSDWKEIVNKASIGDEDNCYLGIIRSEENYFVVKPYSLSQCKEIFNKVIEKNDIKNKILAMSETLGEELRRPYYFDFLVKEINSYKSISDVPSSLSDSDLILRIFDKSLGGIISHLRGFTMLDKYLNGYYDSNFVKTYCYGEHSRIPFDNYVCAYGIIYCSRDKEYKDVVSIQFTYTNNDNTIDFREQLAEVNERIVLLFNSEEKKTINSKFDLKDYFLDMIKYSIEGARICAFVLNKCLEEIDIETREIVFKALAKEYNKILKEKKDIYTHYLLGLEIGKLLPKMNNNCIADGLNYIFKCVNNDYIEPKCNEKGISVIPVTNFEFEKFVKDEGYAKFYSLDSDRTLKEIATEYYKEIFDFIIGALSGKRRKDSNCLARLLKGYGWEHYKQIAYLLSRKEDINNEEIYGAIGENYPEQLLYPAKWKDCANSNQSLPFCNPLQPVVCVNLFEANAYACWLSSKIGKVVRVLNYDPDYLSIIGREGEGVRGKLRQSFLEHIDRQREFINSAENDILFYGKNDIKIKEPSPVAMPNSKFLEIYDFVGNIFETQSTPFTYNYVKNKEVINRELKKIHATSIDYNCPGGGLQRNAANWPPEYMGQVPAFLRNQDIGFRIVIGNDNVGSQEHVNRRVEHMKYTETIEEIFTCSGQEESCILEHIQLDYIEHNNTLEQDFFSSQVFFNTEKRAIVYTSKNMRTDTYKESILLVQSGDNIFAYHLMGITSLHKNINCQEDVLRMIVRKPTYSKDLAVRKKMQNRSCAEWVDIIELVYDNYIDTYNAYPINIINGHFQIDDRKVRKLILDGKEYKSHSRLRNSYLIYFKDDAQEYKDAYYESFKRKLGAEIFLPDWIDIVDFINNICINMTVSKPLDKGTVMAAISTIDTADLHEQINKKILNMKE